MSFLYELSDGSYPKNPQNIQGWLLQRTVPIS